MNTKKHTNAVAVVTGGARGIGFGCAMALAAKGFNLALVDILEKEANEAAGKLRTTGVQAESFIADVSDFKKAQEVAENILQRYESINVLVNNAGISSSNGLLEISESEWDRTIDVNLKSCFNWSRAVVPSMLASGWGRIISISSIASYSGGTISRLAYAASKSGILGMTRSLAKELGPSITVNAICPGTIRTEMNATTYVEGISLGRLGTPEDIGEVVAFLASSEPNFITGQAITVDGFQHIT
jgi:3-oxoacyl-[acyl-carrier protein] reductase